MIPEDLKRLIDEIESIPLPPEALKPHVDDLRRIVETEVARRADEETNSEPNRFYEWSIKRLERRQRRLYWVVGALSAALIATAGFAASRSEGPVASGGTSAAEVTAVQAEVRELRQGLDQDLARLERRLQSRSGDVAALENQVAAVRSCTARGIKALDKGLAALLTRRISANSWVASRSVPDCSARR